MFTCIHERLAGAVGVVVLSGLACLGVPSAAAEELLPTPSETSAVTAPTDETAAPSTPEPTDEQASESTGPETEENPAPTPTVAAEKTLAVAADNVRDPRAYVGDVNCNNLTVPLTLDNSRSTETVFLQVLVEADGEEIPLDAPSQLSAGAVQIVNVPVTEDAEVFLAVWDQGGGVFDEGSTLAFAVISIDCTADGDPHDPQARIGGVDCAQMAVDVTLDNSRSEDETTYLVSASTGEDEEPTYQQTFDVPAGEIQPVLVPVDENVVVEVFVGDEEVLEETDGEQGFLGQELFPVDCTPGDDPRSSIGKVNCTDLTVPVNLDNSRSPVVTDFLIIAGDDEEFSYQDVTTVAAGAEHVVPVSVLSNAEVFVRVADIGAGFGGTSDEVTLAMETFDVDCGQVLAGRAGALPATGANGPTLPLAGLMLLASGGVLTFLSRRGQESAE